MRILFVEDHMLFVEQVMPRISVIPGVDYIKHVDSQSSAIYELENDFFDLIILDLKIPIDTNGLSLDKNNGQSVFYFALKSCPGIQIFILTGSEMDEFTKRLSRHGEKTDLWGSGSENHTLDYFEKENVGKIFDEIEHSASEINSLNHISLNMRGRDLGLTKNFIRILRVAARRSGGKSIEVVPLSGGLSKARVLRCTVRSEQGQILSNMVVKLGPKNHVDLEIRAYHHYVKILPVGFFPPILHAIEKGACGSSGAFYSLAESFDRIFFEVLSNPSNAALVVKRIRERMSIWIDASQVKQSPISALRNLFVTDELKLELSCNYNLDLEKLETKVISYRSSCSHGDLHGGNILVDGNLQPVLIDFGDVGIACSCVDALTIELSCIFHPDGRRILTPQIAEWNIDQWTNRDSYEQGHPRREFIVACREWAYDVAGSDDAFDAISYAYVLRQLKFNTVEKDVTLSLLEKITRKILSSM